MMSDGGTGSGPADGLRGGVKVLTPTSPDDECRQTKT